MPTRPASLAGKTSGRQRRSATGLGRRIRRLVLWALLIALLLPAALLLVFRFVPVPLTPLMVIRLIEGEELHKDWVPLAQIAPALRHAVVAAEDNLFCEHGGFDWTALGEVIDELRAGGRPRGASTITMQTAKNLFLWPDRSLLRKGLEAWLTPQVELIWDKRRILEVYLNIVEMGPGIYGASRPRCWPPYCPIRGCRRRRRRPTTSSAVPAPSGRGSISWDRCSPAPIQRAKLAPTLGKTPHADRSTDHSRLSGSLRGRGRRASGRARQRAVR
jgi:monofunctional biosynthetic peptidoglycan transglycosylase